MPKKKQEEIINPAQEIENLAAKEFLGEDVTLEKKEEVEEEKTEDKEIPKKEEKEIEVDEDEFGKKIAENIVKTQEEISNKKRQEEEEKAKKELEETRMKDEMIPIYVREGRNPKDYAEINEEATRIAELKAEQLWEKKEAERQAKLNEQEEAKKTETQKKEEAQKQYDRYIDSQLDDLVKSNKLPPIKNDKDEKDLGVMERRNLFKTMYDVNMKIAEENKSLPPEQQKPLINSLKEIFYEHYKPMSTQPAGHDAPVAGKTSVVAPSNEDEIDYKEIHKAKDFFSFFKK